MSLGKAHAFTHLALHKIHVRLGVPMRLLVSLQGIFLASSELHFFFLPFFSRSASAFRAPPLPEMKLLTRPIAHAAIGTLRDPLDR